mmetsp:Transcript_66571/g.187497  ORF Transcript_66571/g.187497 Transcript_66571/m.187497 type:complete len:208 (-) Transcript_66571:195-818(-)
MHVRENRVQGHVARQQRPAGAGVVVAGAELDPAVQRVPVRRQRAAGVGELELGPLGRGGERVPQRREQVDRWRVWLAGDPKVNGRAAQLGVDLGLHNPRLVVAEGLDRHRSACDGDLLLIAVVDVREHAMQLGRAEGHLRGGVRADVAVAYERQGLDATQVCPDILRESLRGAAPLGEALLETLPEVVDSRLQAALAALRILLVGVP